MTTHAYLNYIKRLSAKLKLNEKEVVLAFDYTSEDFMAMFKVLIFMDGLEKMQLQDILSF